MTSTRRVGQCVVAGLFLASCGAAYGQGLKGEYFTNMSLSGAAALTRTENVGFNWGGGHEQRHAGPGGRRADAGSPGGDDNLLLARG